MANESRNINRLKGPDQFKFLKWFEDQTFEYGLTDAQIAVRATNDLGFTVTVGNVYGAWDTTEKERARAPKSDVQKLDILKRAVEHLYKEVAMPLPPEWLDL